MSTMATFKIPKVTNEVNVSATTPRVPTKDVCFQY
jgi:hypothetical protein